MRKQPDEETHQYMLENIYWFEATMRMGSLKNISTTDQKHYYDIMEAIIGEYFFNRFTEE